MDKAQSGFWDRFNQRYSEITNTPKYQEERRHGLIRAASLFFVGVPLVIVLMLLGHWMGWPVKRVSPIAITISMAINVGIGNYFSARRKTPA